MKSPIPPMISHAERPDPRIEVGNISDAYWRQI